MVGARAGARVRIGLRAGVSVGVRVAVVVGGRIKVGVGIRAGVRALSTVSERVCTPRTHMQAHPASRAVCAVYVIHCWRCMLAVCLLLAEFGLHHQPRLFHDWWLPLHVAHLPLLRALPCLPKASARQAVAHHGDWIPSLDPV